MPGDLPDWTTETSIGAGGVSAVVATGLLNIPGGGTQDLAFPYAGGFPYLKLLLTDIESFGAKAKLRLQVGTDASGGNYMYQFLSPNLGTTTAFGDTTGIDLYSPLPWGDDTTTLRGDTAPPSRGNVDLTFYNADIVSTGAANGPPVHFWGRHNYSHQSGLGGNMTEFAGAYVGGRWSIDQFWRVFDVAGAPTQVVGKWAVLGYKYP